CQSAHEGVESCHWIVKGGIVSTARPCALCALQHPVLGDGRLVGVLGRRLCVQPGCVPVVEGEEEELAQRGAEVRAQPLLERRWSGGRSLESVQDLADGAGPKWIGKAAQVLLNRVRHEPALCRKEDGGPALVGAEAGVLPEPLQQRCSGAEEPVTPGPLETKAIGDALARWIAQASVFVEVRGVTDAPRRAVGLERRR